MKNEGRRNLIAIDAFFRNAATHRTGKKDKKQKDKNKFIKATRLKDWKTLED